MEPSENAPRRYFKLHYIAMRILGFGIFHHPDENNFDNYSNFFYNCFACFAVVFLVFFVSGEVYNTPIVWYSNIDPDGIFLGISTTGIHVFTLAKIFLVIRHNKKIQKIIKTIEIDSKRFQYNEKITKKTIFYSKALTYYFLVMGNMTITFMAANTTYNDFKKQNLLKMTNSTSNTPRILPFTALILWDYRGDVAYMGATFYCLLGVIWVATGLMIVDTLIASIMAHLSGQFVIIQSFVENIGNHTLQILIGRLNDSKLQKLRKIMNSDQEIQLAGDAEDELFQQEKLEKFLIDRKRVLVYFDETEFNKVMVGCIKEVIEYHQLIIETTQELQEAYTLGFLCQILSSFYSIGIVFVQVALNVDNLFSLNFASNMGYLVSILWQLFMQTYSANEVTLQASKVGNSAYGSYWYAVDHDNGERRRLLQLLIHRSQKKIHLTAGKFSSMSNELFVTVLRRSYQIFTLITTAMK